MEASPSIHCDLERRMSLQLEPLQSLSLYKTGLLSQETLDFLAFYTVDRWLLAGGYRGLPSSNFHYAKSKPRDKRVIFLIYVGWFDLASIIFGL